MLTQRSGSGLALGPEKGETGGVQEKKWGAIFFCGRLYTPLNDFFVPEETNASFSYIRIPEFPILR